MCCCFPNKGNGGCDPTCPCCEQGRLRPEGSAARCDRCGDTFDAGMVKTLRQIIALPTVPAARAG